MSPLLAPASEVHERGSFSDRLDGLGITLGGVRDKLDACQVDTRGACTAVMSLRSDVAALSARLESVESGVLECVAIVRAEQRARLAAADEARASDAVIDERATMAASEVVRLRAMLAPFVSAASRESSAAASKRVGAYGAIATTAGVLAPHVPWSDIGHAITRIFG